ncbi:MAG TPA: hypothetical protein PKY59_01880 [Pyrinomonadaceae bacterium]|nr:hypothetical protein [Pyrinomonadaceae bacterium]
MTCTQKFVLAVFSIAILIFSIHGQTKSKQDQRIIWKSRADTVTFTLIKDAEKSDPLNRALIYTKLGDLWWKFDRIQANSWFEKSVDLLIYKTDDDAKSENYFQIVSQILKLIADRNAKQTDRLIKLLSESTEVSEKDKNGNADALIDFALLIVKENPNKAAAIGLQAFKIGQPTKFYKLYWELRKFSLTSADKFFKAVLSTAAISQNVQIIAGLKIMIFPEFAFPNAPSEIRSSDSIKAETLSLFADFIIQQQAKFSNKSISNCESEAFIFAPLKEQFYLFTPQKANLVEQAFSICLSNKNQAVNNLATSNLQNKNNVDELLKLADESQDDVKVRAYYLFRAANLANNQEKYKIATQILDGMTDEEKNTDSAFWDELRYTVAAGLAFQQYKEQDFQGADRTLEQVAIKNRPFAKIGFALKFSPNDISAREFIIENIAETRKELPKSEKNFAEKSPFWFLLIKIYANYSLMAESAEVFREIVSDFNKSYFEKESKNETKISSNQIISVFSSNLIESQDNSLFEIANIIKDEKSRIETNVGFLKIILEKYDALPVKSNNKNP